MNEDKTINDKGFVVRPEYYNQEQWCEMYLAVIRMYKILYEEHEQLKITNESLTSLVNSCQNKIRQLQNNWNKLMEWLKKENREDAIKINLSWKLATSKVLRKMQELEQGKDE